MFTFYQEPCYGLEIQLHIRQEPALGGNIMRQVKYYILLCIECCGATEERIINCYYVCSIKRRPQRGGDMLGIEE